MMKKNNPRNERTNERTILLFFIQFFLGEYPFGVEAKVLDRTS